MWRNLQQSWRRWNSLGARGEREATRLLRRSGYRILARNLHTRFGEIDILAEDRGRGHLVVVEVKAGESDDPPPEGHVNFAKRRKLTALAAQLARRYRVQNRLIRFDVVGVVWPHGARRPTRVTHHHSAFESTL